MIKIFRIITICFLLITTNLMSLNLNAATVVEDQCGMTTEESGLVVEKESTEICEGDISFTVLYLLFHKIFDQDDVKTIFEEIAPISTNVKQFAAAAGIGDTIVAIFEALTSIIISVATLLISYSVIKILYKTQTNGEFMGDRRAKVFSVIFNSLLIIFLITPVGSVVVVQLLVLILAIMGIMIANFFWSTFLYATSVKTTEATLNEEQTIQQASSTVSGIVETNACMARTNQKILNNNFKLNSHYNRPNLGFTLEFSSEFYSDNDRMPRAVDKVHECLRYYIEPIINSENIISAYSITRPNVLTCAGFKKIEGIDNYFKYTGAGMLINGGAEAINGINFAKDYAYDEASFGAQHNCGTMTYNTPNLQNMFADNEDSEWFSDLNAEDQIDLVKGIYNPESIYNNFSSQAESRINAMLDSEITSEAKRDLYKSYESFIEELKTGVKKNLEIDGELNNKVKGKLIYVKAITILNQLYGAGAFDEDNDDVIKVIDVEVKKNGTVENIENDIHKFEFLNKKGAKIYDEFEQAHCAKNWENLRESRKTVAAINVGLEEELRFDKVLGGMVNDFNFECTQLTNKTADNEDRRFIYNIKVDGYDINKDIKVNGESIEINKLSDEEYAQILSIMKNVIYPAKIKEAMKEKYLLEGYLYSVKMAVSKALTETLKDIQDDSLLLKMRKDGWATSGAMMLQITMEQGNASVFKEGMSITGNMFSKISNTDNLFYNIDALQTEGNVGEENETENEKKEFYPIIISEFLSTQNRLQDFSNAESVDRIIEDSERGMFEGFLGNMENMLFYPISYIKQASGLDQNATIQEGLEECRNTDRVCVSQDTHPLNALMLFGQETMNMTLTIMIVDLVVQALNILVDQVVSGKAAGGVGEQGFLNKMISSVKSLFVAVGGFVAGALLVIIKAVAILLNLIRPFVIALFGAGIFLGYVVPTIPYVAFAIVFMGWIISIFQTMIALPILVLFSASSTGQNNLSPMRFWQLTGGILLKPSLVTIAIIFGWTLSSISLYYINATVYSIFSATRPDDAIIGIIHMVLVYIMYISLIYIVVHHSFKVINKIPDEILQMMDVKGSGDSQFIESLNFERFMQAKLATDAVGKAYGGAHKKIGDHQKKLNIRKQKVQKQTEIEKQRNSQNDSTSS